MEPGLKGGFTVEPPSFRLHKRNRLVGLTGEPLPSYLDAESQFGGPEWVDSPVYGPNLHSEDPGRSSRMNGEEPR